MDQKKVNLTLIFSLIIFGIGISIKSLASYFGGFGVPFVAILVFLVLILINGVVNKENRRRLLDIFVLVAISLIFAIVTYCSTEWVNQMDLTLKDVEFINEWCICYSIFSSIFLIYGLLRYISEISEKKWDVFEYILFLKKMEKRKVTVSEKYNRQPKEVMNGDLEQKPVKIETEEEKPISIQAEVQEEKREDQEENNSNFNQY